MNPETLLTHVGNKLLTAALGSTGYIRVCWLDGEFQCLNSVDRRAPELVIARFHADKIVSGLTPDEWTKLSNNLTTFLKERGS